MIWTILILSLCLYGCLAPSTAQGVQDTLDSPGAITMANSLDMVLGSAGLPPVTSTLLGYAGALWALMYGTRKGKGFLRAMKDSGPGEFTAKKKKK